MIRMNRYFDVLLLISLAGAMFWRPVHIFGQLLYVESAGIYKLDIV